MHPHLDTLPTPATSSTTGLQLQGPALVLARVLWASPDNQVFVGRTQDWTEKADSAFRVYPRGIERSGAVAENPHKWTSKYGSLVITGYDLATHEGVNEKGLSAHALYLAEENSFPQRDPRQPGIGVMQWVQYYLDNYATVAEAVAASSDRAVTSTVTESVAMVCCCPTDAGSTWDVLTAS